MADNTGIGIFGSSSNPGASSNSSTSFSGSTGGGNSIWNSIFSNLGNILVGTSTVITAAKTDPNQQAAANQSFLERLFAMQNAGNAVNNRIPSWVWVVGLLLVVFMIIMLVAKNRK